MMSSFKTASRSRGACAGWLRAAPLVFLLAWTPALLAQGPLPRPEPRRPMPAVDLDQVLADLPTGDCWIRHLREELLPFWLMDTALGKPLGNFPTYRANDGSLFDPDHPAPELANADQSIVKLDRDYVRAKSRQVFAYGVAYHLTGDEKLLRYCKAGADWLIEHAIDKERGGAYSWFYGPEQIPQPPVK